MKRTPVMEPNSDFQVAIPITKSYVDSKTGERHIIGVATGVAEDRDGERCSKSCVVGMGQQIEQGGVKVTSDHKQDWMTEIGDVAKYTYDAETDEMTVDGVLPPEGDDPIADKAWKVANRERVGWSIGGKLLKSYFERNELGKNRKVLDSIRLKHIMLTKNPAYPTSFAEAVAKTYDGEPEDSEFTLDGDVEKDMTTGSWVSGDSDSGGGNTGRDSVGSGQRNAGSKDPKSKGMNTEDDDADDDDKTDQDVPKAKDERHLACPHCGHEFAADLPVDPEERQADSTDQPDDKDQADTGKSVEIPPMSTTLTDTLDALKALAAADEVTKTDPQPESEATDVAKQPTGEDLEVAKLVAASHKAHEDRFGTLEAKTGEGFELVAKAIKGLTDRIADLPQGRKSTARILPPSTGHDDTEGEPSVEKEINDAESAVDALKASNKHHWGIN